LCGVLLILLLLFLDPSKSGPDLMSKYKNNFSLFWSVGTRQCGPLNLRGPGPGPWCLVVETAMIRSRLTLQVRVKLRLHQDTCCRHKLYPLVAVNMFLVSATKLLSVYRPSVAGYKGIQNDRDINE